ERQGSLEDDERGIQRENGIDYDQIITNSAHWLGVYDVDLIMSWTPNEYKLLLKGAKLRKIDELELMAKNAMFHRYAMNEKRPKEKKMYDADKARRQLERNITGDNDKWRKSDVNEL
ncbi:hypothetical protein, partial [Bacillus tropicus]|uniref:hypothetical protein n=1 Tax=Bacillus tropicus TaxID=2026188 RepID=UPI0021C10BD2